MQSLWPTDSQIRRRGRCWTQLELQPAHCSGAHIQDRVDSDIWESANQLLKLASAVDRTRGWNHERCNRPSHAEAICSQNIPSQCRRDCQKRTYKGSSPTLRKSSWHLFSLLLNKHSSKYWPRMKRCKRQPLGQASRTGRGAWTWLFHLCKPILASRNLNNVLHANSTQQNIEQLARPHKQCQPPRPRPKPSGANVTPF